MIDQSKDYIGNLQTHKVGGINAVNSGQITTTGGSASEAVTLTSKYIEAGDHVIASLEDNGTNDVTLITAKVTADSEVTFVFSGDPSSDTIVNYFILKA